MRDKVEVFCSECAKPFWVDRVMWELSGGIGAAVWCSDECFFGLTEP